MNQRIPPEALASLDQPRPVPAGKLTPASCLDCHRETWTAEWGLRTDGRAFLLDLVEVKGDRLLSIHPCGEDLGAEDLDDPDWGWVTG